MTAYDLAKKNYPRTWTKEMLKALVANPKAQLTAEQYEELTGEVYSA